MIAGNCDSVDQRMSSVQCRVNAGISLIVQYEPRNYGQDDQDIGQIILRLSCNDTHKRKPAIGTKI